MEPTEFDKEIAENQKPTKEQEERMRKLMDDITKALERRIEYEKTMMSEWDRWYFEFMERHPTARYPDPWETSTITKEELFKDLDIAVEKAHEYAHEEPIKIPTAMYEALKKHNLELKKPKYVQDLKGSTLSDLFAPKPKTKWKWKLGWHGA
jgi:hypothetical protein